MLVITIIVMIILAGAIILSLVKGDIITKARRAVEDQKKGAYQEEFDLWISDKVNADTKLDSISATEEVGSYEDNKIQDIIPGMTDEDAVRYQIIKGKLIDLEDLKDVTKERLYTDAQITNMINNQGYIPISTAAELNNIRYYTQNTFGSGTAWAKSYTGGLDKKYIQVANIDLSSYSENGGWKVLANSGAGEGNSTFFVGVYDGGNYIISNMTMTGEKSFPYNGVGLFGFINSQSDNLVEIKNLIMKNVNINVNRIICGSFVRSSYGKKY